MPRLSTSTLSPVASDRLGELLELVLERNPFQRARLEQLGLAGQPQPVRPAAARQAGARRGPGSPPPVRHQPAPIRSSATPSCGRPAAPQGRRCGCSTPRRTGRWWRGLFAHTLTVAGVRAGDRVALAFSFGPHVQFWAAYQGLQEVGAMALALGGMTSVQRLKTIAETEATAVWCTPTYALRLLEVAVEQRLDHALESVRQVICTGEPGASLPAVRSRIEEGFGAALRGPRGPDRGRSVRLPVPGRARAARARGASSCARSSTTSCAPVATRASAVSSCITPLRRHRLPGAALPHRRRRGEHRRALPGGSRRTSGCPAG